MPAPPPDLASWKDTATRQAIVAFVERVTQDGGADYVPPADRVAVFDNDGTLWCEKLDYQDGQDGGSLVYLAKPDVFDDGPVKPVRIWSRTGRRPILAAGNSNGDIPILHFARGPSGQALRLLRLHDDAEREFDYTAGAERSLQNATDEDWTVVSIERDWSTVFTGA